MSAATFNDAIAWIALNDDSEAGNPDLPLVTEAMTADLFGTTTDHVCECVARFRAYEAKGMPAPRMKTMNRRDRAALAKAGAL